MDAHAVVARVLDRAQLQHAGAGGRHLEHLLEGHRVQLARVGHDPRVGGVHAGDVGVDFAHLRAERGGDRHRGRVRAAAPERGDVLGRSRRPGSPPPARCGPPPAPPGCVGAHVDDPRLGVRLSVTIPACEPVSEIARWPRSLIAIAHSAQEMRSPVDSSMSISRGSGAAETSSAIAISSSVVLPRAESTATTRAPPSRLLDDAPRGALDALGVGDGGAAELHHDDVALDTHGRIRSSPGGRCTSQQSRESSTSSNTRSIERNSLDSACRDGVPHKHLHRLSGNSRCIGETALTVVSDRLAASSPLEPLAALANSRCSCVGSGDVDFHLEERDGVRCSYDGRRSHS